MQLGMQERFIRLTKTEQVVKVLQKGKPHGERKTKCCSVKLFLLENFYVELWYSADGNKIVKVKPVSAEKIKRLYGA